MKSDGELLRLLPILKRVAEKGKQGDSALDALEAEKDNIWAAKWALSEEELRRKRKTSPDPPGAEEEEAAKKMHFSPRDESDLRVTGVPCCIM